MAEQDDRITFSSDPQEISQQLIQVNDQKDLVERFYPGIVNQLVGKKKRPLGLCMIFALAIYDFTQPSDSIALATVLNTHVPKWFDAIIGDKAAAEAAKNEWREVLQAS